ncbi:MoaD/ThiS family protein [Sphingomonas agri]|uniref:MoaD/ThiS family protein n=1 Tax=Sphingomonas agri TaxID=1813878 RepID=UPI00311F5A50
MIRFYGRLADAIGREANVETLGGTSVGQIRSRLLADHPHAAEALRRSRACLNDMFVEDVQLVTDEDQVDFLPPVSGG